MHRHDLSNRWSREVEDCDMYWCPVLEPHCRACRPFTCGDMPQRGRVPGTLDAIVRFMTVVAVVGATAVALIVFRRGLTSYLIAGLFTFILALLVLGRKGGD